MDTKKSVLIRPTLELFAAQAQSFASSWSLVGGPFGGGNSMEDAEVERGILLDMARRLIEDHDAARQEIASLQAQAWQCGAGAGCCAQAARIEALQGQLEAVGAGGVGPLMGAPVGVVPFALLVRKKSWNEGQWECAPSGCPEYGRQWADERVWVYTAPQPAAQAQEDAVAQAVAAEREACAQVCESWADEHDYAGAIRARGTDAS